MSSVNSKYIAKNTLILYFRMVLIMGVTLYTSRVVLNVLGVEDYGIYNVVGGIVTMFAFLNTSMSIAVQRFLSFEMGRKESGNMSKVFNISVITHIIIALLVLIVAETLGLWFVREKLIIPTERLQTAIWVFHFSIFACIISIIQVPYNALIISHEKMNIYAYISIIEVLLRLGIVYLLLIIYLDKLFLYAFLTLGVSTLIGCFYIGYCRKKYKETKWKFEWDKIFFCEIFSFAGWSLFGEFAWVCALQGVNILLNLFFGPFVNAARAIAFQGTGAINKLSVNFQTAINPQIIKSYAGDEKCMMIKLILRGTSFSFYLLFVISLPLLLEMEQILTLWLKVVPEYTSIFCRIAIINALLDILSALLITAVRAYGRIRQYQILVSLFLVMNLPLSYVALKLGGTPEIPLYIYSIISICLLGIRLILLRKMISFPVMKFLKEIMHVLFICIMASLFPVFLNNMLPQSISRLVLVFLFSVLSIGLFVYLGGLKKDERLYVNKLIGNKLKNGKK